MNEIATIFNSSYADVLKNKYALFTGRSRRHEYWMFTLVNLVITMVLAVIDGVLGLHGILMLVYGLATLLPCIGLSIRRLHDTSRSGWWLLLALVPVANLVLLYFMVLDSTPGDNAFGANPKGVTGAAA